MFRVNAAGLTEDSRNIVTERVNALHAGDVVELPRADWRHGMTPAVRVASVTPADWAPGESVLMWTYTVPPWTDLRDGVLIPGDAQLVILYAAD